MPLASTEIGGAGARTAAIAGAAGAAGSAAEPMKVALALSWRARGAVLAAVMAPVLEPHASPSMAEISYSIYTSAMALSIKSDEADQLARELAAETGETLTEAVVIALRERLDREHARHGASMRMRLARLAADVATLPVADGRTPEEIIGYNDAGLPS